MHIVLRTCHQINLRAVMFINKMLYHIRKRRFIIHIYIIDPVRFNLHRRPEIHDRTPVSVQNQIVDLLILIFSERIVKHQHTVCRIRVGDTEYASLTLVITDISGSPAVDAALIPKASKNHKTISTFLRNFLNGVS